MILEPAPRGHRDERVRRAVRRRIRETLAVRRAAALDRPRAAEPLAVEPRAVALRADFSAEAEAAG